MQPAKELQPVHPIIVEAVTLFNRMGEKATVYMHGLAEMQRNWAKKKAGGSGKNRKSGGSGKRGTRGKEDN